MYIITTSLHLEKKNLIFETTNPYIKITVAKSRSINMNINTLKVNFKGGIIPHNHLYNILVAASKSNVHYVRFGLRQQFLLDVEIENLERLTAELNMLGISYEINKEEFPNIVSSFPAEEIIIK